MTTAHASFGASGAHRWLVCAASVPLSVGMPDTTNEHAAEGTAAHELGEMALRSGKDCDTYLGMVLHVEGFEFEVDDDMAANVQIYVDHVRNLGGELAIEHRFDLSKIRPPVPMFGTADAVVYNPGEFVLEVIDLKYGRGKVVDVNDNPQLKYYGLGALLAMKPGTPVDVVRLTVVQPRAGNGAVRSVDIAPEALLDYALDIIEAAKRALGPDPEATPGDHCRWCKAAGVCPALRGQALTVAQDEFGALPNPNDLTPAQLAEILDKADIIEEWLRAFRGHVYRQVESGVEVPGLKLVPKRAMRKWVGKEADIEAQLIEAGAVKDDLYKKELISPAQAEKLVGKKNLPQGLIAAVSSGYNLVRDSDSRPGVEMLPAGHEFTTD